MSTAGLQVGVVLHSMFSRAEKLLLFRESFSKMPMNPMVSYYIPYFIDMILPIHPNICWFIYLGSAPNA